MKVCTYVQDGRERLGFVVGSEVVEAPEQFGDMLSFIRAGEAGRRAAEAALAGRARKPLASVKLAAP
ncbi:MAG: hypothetical protein ACREUN_17045, partial [Burkholderiales bacterium]